jgi:hypothetical protein
MVDLMDGWICNYLQEYNYLYFCTKHFCCSLIESQIAGMDRNEWWQHQAQMERTSHCKCDKFNIHYSIILKSDLIGNRSPKEQNFCESYPIEWLWPVGNHSPMSKMKTNFADGDRLSFDIRTAVMRDRTIKRLCWFFDWNRFVASRDLPFNNHFANSTMFRIRHIPFQESPSSTFDDSAIRVIVITALWWLLTVWLQGIKYCETITVTCNWFAWVCKEYL